MALAAAAIPFRIVPGISAGIGGTAAASVPLTHRGVARSVAFATGHDSSGDLTDLDWDALSRGAEVLVLYMAARQLDVLSARLIAAGRDPAQGVAVIRDATRATQTVEIATLAEAGSIPVSSSPTLVVVGPVVALRDVLAAWQQTAPMTLRPETLRHAPQPARARG